MWAFLTGYLLSSVFEHGATELFKNEFHNKTLPLRELSIGWLFQEYIKEEFDMTGGKKFVSERDHRNQLFTHILQIVRNLIFYSHLITTLELGTFLWLFCLFFFIASKIYLTKPKNVIVSRLLLKRYYVSGIRMIKNRESTISQAFSLVYKNWDLSISDILLFSSLLLLLKAGFLRRYSWFDLYFILRPILLIVLSICIVFSFLVINYLFYVYFLNAVSKKVAFVLKIVTKKYLFHLICFCNLTTLVMYGFNLQNLTAENFFKEVLFTIIFFFC